MGEREYKISVDARILELLGPNLYTNIYYVLAELIANAYDADADNVYIEYDEKRILVEDDGKGMSFSSGEINNYLNVAKESRKTAKESVTDKGRYKMGRKGVGKLAALSVSEKVLIQTITENGEKSGFILPRRIPDDQLLQAINESEIKLKYSKSKGSSITMVDPRYGLHKDLYIVKKNILRIFPLIDDKFKITLINGKNSLIIDSNDGTIIDDLACLITFGEDFKNMTDKFKTEYKDNIKNLLSVENEIRRNLVLTEKNSLNEKTYELVIKGWIGAYKTTKGRKATLTDFPDNFISIFANKKLGEFNVLPEVGQNKLLEVYVVGQLHVDLFEETSLPDMALSNRQGYKSDDRRYEIFRDIVRMEILPKIINFRANYTELNKSKKKMNELNKHKASEDKFKEDVVKFKSELSQRIKESIRENRIDLSTNFENITQEIDRALPLLGLKTSIENNKKELLISHTSTDRNVADLVYEMLVENGIPRDKVIYSSSTFTESRIPFRFDIYEYLRSFFVESISDKKPLVVFITSEIMSKKWGAVLEAGAAWITKKEHLIFNIEKDLSNPTSSYHPISPLDVGKPYNVIEFDYQINEICMTMQNVIDFCDRVAFISNTLGYRPKSQKFNIDYLKDRVRVI